MRVKRLFAFLFFIALFTGIHFAFAYESEMGFHVAKPASEESRSDLYVLGWSVTLNNPIQGDLFVLGGTVRVHGPVHGSVFLAGGNLEIDGPVDGDINLIGFNAESRTSCRTCRIVSLDANQQGNTTADLLEVGGVIGSSGNIQGDTLMAGEVVNLEGDHFGNVFALSRHRLNIQGKIEGTSKFKAESITIGKSAAINGDLTYTSPNDISGDIDNIKGTVIHKYPLNVFPRPLQFPWVYVLTHKIFSAVWLCIVGMVSLIWFPRSSQSVVDTMLHFPWESLGLGVVLFVAVPGIAFLLIVSFLGIPLGIFLFGIFGIGIYLTRLFGSLYIGERILGALEHHVPPYWQSLPLGVFVFTLLTSIPWIGIGVSLIVIPLALGAKALLGWRVYRRMRLHHLA